MDFIDGNESGQTQKTNNNNGAQPTNSGMGYFNFAENAGLTNEIAVVFKKMLDDNKAPFKVVVFDKTSYPRHSYDNILVVYTKGNIHYGFVLMVVGSGQGPVQLNHFISSFQKKSPIFLPARTMEPDIINVMKQAIGAQTLVITGQLGYTPVTADERVLGAVLGKAVNGIAEEAGMIVPNTINNKLDYALNLSPFNGDYENIFGMAKAMTWNASISSSTVTNVMHPNKLNDSGVIIDASGTVDILTTRRDERTPQGIVQVADSRPVVQLNQVNTIGAEKQGVTQALLGIFTTDFIAARSNWVLPLLASRSNPGALAKHYGDKVIKLNDNSLPIEKKRQELSKLITQEAMICLSVDDISLEGGPMAKFVSLGLGNGQAGKDIVTALHNLTGGKFLSNYPVDKIVEAVVSLPSGTYVDNNTGKTHDLGELNQLFFLNADAKHGLQWAFRYCQIIANETNDSFSNMITLLDEVIGGNNVSLMGSRALVYLNAEFLSLAIAGMAGAGLRPQFDDMLEDNTVAHLANGTGLAGASRNYQGLNPTSYGSTPNYGSGSNFAIGGAYYKN